MSYQYVTENNLENKQTYMYSEYGGIHFLKEYIATRREYINKYEGLEENKTEDNEKTKESTSVMMDLLEIRKTLNTDKSDRKTMDLINAYTKSFEVRKRIYQKYDNNWKPIGSKNFKDYELYLVFAECLILSYQHTQCLKYFNCLLKVDDSLLSICDKMGDRLKGNLSQIIKKELDFFYQIAERNGISLGE